MLIKVTRGGNPGDLCRYVLDPRKQPEKEQAAIESNQSVGPILVCSTMPGSTAEQLAQYLRQIAQLNSRVEKIVAHYSISLPPSDGGQIERSQMAAISKAMLHEMGHNRCPYFGVEHHDATQKHWHLVASTVSYAGKWVDDSFDRHRLRTVERELEQKFGLTRSQPRSPDSIRNLTTGEYRMKERTGEPVAKEKLWAAIDSCLEGNDSLIKFILEMRARYPEISVRVKERKGKKIGISYSIDGIGIAGYKLGKAYSLAGLGKYHQLQNDPKSAALIDEVLLRSPEECIRLKAQLEAGLETSSRQKPGSGLEL
ncbi:MAG: hypothetical protein DCF15_06020 [Phormidesmis priestleyi]|uniref:MobA/VirD2-like nuclease domain-containing protein n=1 Tax=Phormidesmis priestleyi TaxID=268141 RepID=A0A2W4ZIP3_9CYAN|nr:MAG: hypothetical protein DCF15_06020 [Phormidesmis priestleyi]